ncbi:MAG: hypothetical protein J6T18_07825 [Bacteroidaceae bacterium]|nr:hypothetical protein [Bacteroidaceae bacterium]
MTGKTPKEHLKVNAAEITEKEMKQVMIDSTVQEKNITFPTDAKLYRKIVDRVLKLSEREGIELRKTYTREMKSLKLKVRFMNHPTRMKEERKAVKRMRTIARAMVNDIARKMYAFQLQQYGKGTIGDGINPPFRFFRMTVRRVHYTRM